MGDYTKSGEKIGTCGAGYYATKQMLEDLNEKGGDVEAYLNPKNNCSFAFPFPEYDGKEVGEISNYHDDMRVNLHFFYPANRLSHHKKVLYQLKPQGVPMKNLYCECPQKYNEETKEGNIYFRLSEQVYFEGKLCITAECPYCENVNIFDKEEAEMICNDYFDHYSENPETQAYYSEIAKRIRATYE